MKKHYHLDTCTLLDQENAIDVLRNGEENKIYISMTVINELDGLMKSNKRHLASASIDNILKNKEHIIFTGDLNGIENNDDKILNNVEENGILVTNDKMLRLKAYIRNKEAQEFLITNPFKNESEKYTGFVGYEKGEDLVENCFYFKQGKLFHYTEGEEKFVNYDVNAWTIQPKNIYQKAAMDLILNDKIPLISLQGQAGTGKSLISLACAMKMAFEQKKYNKIYIMRYPSIIGEDLGYIPGKIEEKYAPHWEPVLRLLLNLYQKREYKKLFTGETENGWPLLNKSKIEFLPVGYLRGMTLENCIIILDESQNITRSVMRTMLTRMGNNVKVICNGDITQIDNPVCNTNNNALNWMVKYFKGESLFAHLMIKGNGVRGPITQMVLDSGF